MAQGINVEFIGRLGGDVEMKTAKTSGNQFPTFNVAVDEFKGGKKVTTWINVAVFNPSLNHMVEYLKKGSLVQVRGAEDVRIYFDRNGVPQIGRTVRAFDMNFVPTNNKPEEDAQNVSCGTISNPQQVIQEVATQGVNPQPQAVQQPQQQFAQQPQMQPQQQMAAPPQPQYQQPMQQQPQPQVQQPVYSQPAMAASASYDDIDEDLPF